MLGTLVVFVTLSPGIDSPLPTRVLTGCTWGPCHLVTLSAEDPAVLVKRLGDSSFAVREAAEAELAGLGPAAQGALEAGARNPDAEIRSRCQRLLLTVRGAERKARIEAFLADTEDRPAATLPGWAKFRSLVKDPARKAFVPLFEGDSILLDLAARDPRAAATALAERTRELAVLLLVPERDKEALAALPAWLLVATDPAVPVEPATLTGLYAGLSVLARRETPRKQMLATLAGPELLLATLQRGGEGSWSTTLPLAGELELKAARPWAAKLATDAKLPAPKRALAILLLARLSDPLAGADHRAADVAVLTPLLGDKSPVGTVTVTNVNLSAELGDVALAAILHLRGENPADYGFPYYQTVPGLKTLPSAERLGFADAAGRAAALAKWRAKSPRDKP
jgi:hypothetical protein